MDIYSTASGAIRDIYAITIFIRTVIDDGKKRQQALNDIQAELEHEFLFVETFNILFFGNGDQWGPWFRSLPYFFQLDLENILASLRRYPKEYDNVALKHGLDLSEANAALGGDEEQITPSVSDVPKEKASKDKIRRFRSKKKIQFEETKKDLEWALFDQDKIKTLVKQYKIWTEKLRQVMMLVLCVRGKLGNYNTVELEIDDGAEISKTLRVTEAVRRQNRAKSKHPEDYPALEGRFDPDNDGHTGPASTYTVGGFQHQRIGTYRAIMETYGFAFVDSSKSEKEKQEMKLELVRRLAWLLEGDISVTQSTDPNDGTTPMYLLDCLGYYEYELVERENEVRSREANPKLHSEEQWELLGEKYKIVSEREKLKDEPLASTLYDIHASGWVHKGIWSRAILVFQTPKTSRSDQQTVPYLWEYRKVSKFHKDGVSKDSSTSDDAEKNDPEDDSKPGDQADADSDADFDVEIEPAGTQGFNHEHELYRHPDRYQGGTATYENKHIYSLGVSLLEIGLWSTISMEMSTAIASARQSSSPPKLADMKQLQEKIRLMSQDPRLANQMGSGYANIVCKCLKGSFKCLKWEWKGKGEGGDDAALTREFHELVVEPLRLRASLF
ncbi:hypothetical protein EDB81DRAFT_845825 [Dactylonectria macrodidyma]|uniref:Prion-inhibition and propagation HeLo domain-containing protein n=1 Tax=Dactylonectria macrodidyma TaxID=307937 RepID=A0A9P9IS60_9HYPO|nr:hypothetical protein EDB81DRAFT_845825 [Dactylonectria macrodidyma]